MASDQPICAPSAGFQSFQAAAPGLRAACPRLQGLAAPGSLAEARAAAAVSYAEEIASLRERLSDPDLSVGVIDFPIPSTAPGMDDLYWAAVSALGIASNLFTIMPDQVNGTPFSMFASTPTSGSELERAGFGKYGASEHLDFHTDGTIDKTQVRIPSQVMIFNLVISYRKPGSFRWLPFARWRDKRRYEDLIGSERFLFELTQAAYEQSDGSFVAHGRKEVVAPIFIDPVGSGPMFLNGKLSASEAGSQRLVDLAREMTASMAAAPGVMSVDQRVGRAIFVANGAGAHSRDTFEHADASADEFTRVYFRATSREGFPVTALDTV